MFGAGTIAGHVMKKRARFRREVDPMQAIYAEILVIASLILARGLLAMSEFAIGSARKSRLRDWSSQGDRGAGAALSLSEDPKSLLWTTQAGSVLLETLAGALGGVALAPQLSRTIERIGALAPYRDPIAFCLVVLAIVVTILVVGELAPKRIALHRPERIARIASRPIRALTKVAMPFVKFLSAITDLVLRLLGVRPAPEPPVTEEEIKVMVREGTKAGVFEEEEHEMIKRVFRFGDRRARALMTPRNKIVWIDLADSPDEVRRKVQSSPHNRFPVCDQSLDNLLGIVQVKDLLGQTQNAEPFRIKGKLTLPLFLYEGTRGLKILEMFKKSATRVAVILD
jgi:putative hemolysin